MRPSWVLTGSTLRFRLQARHSYSSRAPARREAAVAEHSRQQAAAASFARPLCASVSWSRGAPPDSLRPTRSCSTAFSDDGLVRVTTMPFLLAQVVLSPDDTLRIAKEVEAMWNRGALVTNAVVMGLWAAVWGWAL